MRHFYKPIALYLLLDSFRSSWDNDTKFIRNYSMREFNNKRKIKKLKPISFKNFRDTFRCNN